MSPYKRILSFCILLFVTCFNGLTQERPNILFAFADDWGRYASAYSKVDGGNTPNAIVHTPHFDRVASEGALFKNAFVTAPSCTPCRSSILSGQYFFRTGRGAILQGAQWDSSIPSFPLLLKDAGYHIGETYKVWSPGQPVDAPFGAGAYAYQQSGNQFNQFSQTVTRDVASGSSIEDATQRLYDQVMGNFEAFIKDRREGQPFCYWFGPTLVHRKWTKGSGKDLWGIEPDDLKGKLPAFLPDAHEVRQDFADYLGEIQAFDAALGLLLNRLESLGELDNTLVVVSGDHGPPGFPGGKCNLYDFGVAVPLAIRWGQHPGDRVVEDFVNLMDLAPTFLEAAGLQPPKVMTGRSLVPVLKSNRQGWVDPRRDWVITGRERHVAKARAGNLPYPQRALRTKDYLYILNFKPDRWPMGDPANLDEGTAPDWTALQEDTFSTFADFDASPTKAWLVEHRNDPQWQWHYQYAFGKRPAEELYSLATDPDQIKNMASDPNYQLIRQTLKSKLLTELKRAEDPRVMQTGGPPHNCTDNFQMHP